MRKLTALLILSLSLIAASRHISVEGRVRSAVRDRDGYRVYLERSTYSFFVPASLLGRRPLRAGAEVRLDGVLRGGTVWVDDIDWRDRIDRYDDTVTGRVDRFNRFEQRIVIRDDRGRMIDIDLRSVDERHRRFDIGDIHRGDRITVRGRWERGTFYAFRIENVSPR